MDAVGERGVGAEKGKELQQFRAMAELTAGVSRICLGWEERRDGHGDLLRSLERAKMSERNESLLYNGSYSRETTSTRRVFVSLPP